MKERIEKLIKSLARKDLTFGCVVSHQFEKFIYSEKRINQFGAEKFLIRSIENRELDNHLGGQERFREFEVTRKKFKIIGHPVYIGDVLESMRKKWSPVVLNDYEFRKIVELWAKCGFTKSLNELMECEWEKQNYCCDSEQCECDIAQREAYETEVPKKKEIKELFEFILNL